MMSRLMPSAESALALVAAGAGAGIAVAIARMTKASDFTADPISDFLSTVGTSTHYRPLHGPARPERLKRRLGAQAIVSNRRPAAAIASAIPITRADTL